MLTTHLSINLKVKGNFLEVSLIDSSLKNLDTGKPIETVISSASVSLESLQLPAPPSSPERSNG
jgi:hypothetical protein